MRLSSFAAVALIAISVSCGSESGTNAGPIAASVVITGTRTVTTPGTPLQLTVSAFDAAGTLIANPGVFAWASSAPSVAGVTQTGLVTPVAPGTVTVSAALRGVTGSISVEVAPLTQATKDTIFTLPLAFSPDNVTIKAGQSVTFLFAGDLHNVIFKPANPSGSPPDIQETKNVAVTRSFNTKGTFAFDCLIHPGMSGFVVVQ